MYSVFLADDEPWIVIGLKKMIQRSELPFQVIGEANNGVTTLDEIESKKPDVLLTDIRMPGLTGLELLEQMNDRGIACKAVFITGYADFEYAQSALRMGAYDYLVKPVEEETLHGVLTRLQATFREERGEACAADEAPPIDTGMLESILREIREHYTENISLNSLAEEHDVSASYLSRQIKERLGLPFSEYITARRVQRAKELLAQENLSIDAIAEMVGYNDYFYFVKVFKKVVGLSPSKYRKTI